MITEGTPHWHWNTNLHSIWSYGLPLGATCTCGHKAAIPLHRLGQLQGCMRNVKTLPLRCSSCGGRTWTATVFVTMHEVEAFNGRPLTDEELVP